MALAGHRNEVDEHRDPARGCDRLTIKGAHRILPQPYHALLAHNSMGVESYDAEELLNPERRVPVRGRGRDRFVGRRDCRMPLNMPAICFFGLRCHLHLLARAAIAADLIVGGARVARVGALCQGESDDE